MTRGEAINWIINLTADIGKVEHRDLWHYEQALEEIRDMIEAMPLEQPEWIPCNERLPEEEKIYLVTYSNGIAGTSSWHKDTKCNLGFDGVMNGILDDGRIVVYGVIAWMPLPEPYQGGQ